ncbi:hypothetical protein SCUCBS95973_005087 [Sporothrix curviconia]|uniref:SGNH hydrolase-type esterase domain-containing protein n=1 Tax=Sporothrix curviconia TaxID=1260050 RepID=A0ABP0BUT9_9PEZI
MAAPYPQIVLFGDSLFRHAADTLDGFSLQAALQWHAQRRFDVVNRGLSGYNTSQALKVLPSLFPPSDTDNSSSSVFTPKLAYLFVLFGANDAVLPPGEGSPLQNSQHVPLAAYEANLKAILTHRNIQVHQPTIVLVTPPPLDGFRRSQFEQENPGAGRRTARVTAQYAEAARRVAQAVPGVVLADLWSTLMDYALDKTSEQNGGGSGGGGGQGQGQGTHGHLLGDSADPESQAGHLAALLWDGLHFTSEGYRVFWERVLKPLVVLPADAADSTEGFITPGYETAPWTEGQKEINRKE